MLAAARAALTSEADEAFALSALTTFDALAALVVLIEKEMTATSDSRLFPVEAWQLPAHAAVPWQVPFALQALQAALQPAGTPTIQPALQPEARQPPWLFAFALGTGQVTFTETLSVLCAVKTHTSEIMCFNTVSVHGFCLKAPQSGREIWMT